MRAGVPTLFNFILFSINYIYFQHYHLLASQTLPHTPFTTALPSSCRPSKMVSKPKGSEASPKGSALCIIARQPIITLGLLYYQHSFLRNQREMNQRLACPKVSSSTPHYPLLGVQGCVAGLLTIFLPPLPPKGCVAVQGVRMW